MANEGQLEILKSGVEEWNKWRGEYEGLVDLSAAHLFGADLRHIAFNDVSLVGADLREANLRDANLLGGDLRGASLRRANLNYVRLSHASLVGASLFGANLRDASLIGANLRDADLRAANLRGAYLAKADVSTRFDDVQGLGEIRHRGPSAISPKALEWAQGKLPDVFLKGIGFKDWEILNTKLHDSKLRTDEVIDITYRIADLRTKSPIQTNSIFFSYSSLDQEFVELIEQRFDEEGIRSWRDVHDLGGGPIEPQLDRAIRLSGTVFLVLSKHSVNSDWVEWEVKRARKCQKDRQGDGGERSDVLFPVALDDSWKTCHWPGWLKEQILEYKVVDCSDWKDGGFQEKYETKIRRPLGIYYRDEGE